MIQPGLVAAVHAGLAAAADPTRAPKMQAYMKSALPFLGVAAPAQRVVFRAAFDAHPLEHPGQLTATARALWRTATVREHRYAAVALTGHRFYRPWQGPDLLPLYEEMIVDGAWWDYVDDVAIHRLGPLLARHRDVLDPLLRRWATDPDRWRRRSAVIAQVGLKGDADRDLLYAVVEANLGDPDFFVRKGIGWALRQVAWSDLDEVERFVDACGPRISGLSRREALKNADRIRAARR